MAKSVLIVVAGVIIVAGILTLATPHKTHSAAIADRTFDAPPVRVSAYELWLEYQNNELGADAAYKGKAVLIRGAALGVKKNMDGDYYIAFATGNRFEHVAAFLDRSAYSDASQIRGSAGWWGDGSALTAQTVTLLCVGDGRDVFGPILRHCKMMPTPPNAMPYWQHQQMTESATDSAGITPPQGTPACREADTPPRMLSTVSPDYTAEASANHIQGTVVVGITVDEFGSVKDAHVIKSLGYGLDENALAAVQRYKFAPARKQCQPISAAVDVSVGFRMY